jgi:hypothetical protein
MSTTETESGTQDYVPFTPFQEGYAFEAEPSTLSFYETEAFPSVTPFIAEYAGVETGLTAEAAELHELLSELYDQEFDAVLSQLAQEAWSAATDRAEVFGETVGSSTAEEFLEQWAAPVREQAESMIDNYAQAVTEHDVISMSESELDTFLERLEPRGTGLEPYFEDFLGGLAKKVGALAKKAVAVAKKGLTMIPGVGAMIGKLKALVRPLLDRVLKMALDKLPPQLRPVAKQLAQRLLGKVASEATEEEDFAAPAVPDVTPVQQQFDLDVATLLFAEETEQEVIVTEAMYEAERTDGSPIAELHEARARFVDELDRGVDPQEALENFIPAVMAVLPIARTVIGVIGRQRVVSFLAGFLATMIGKYVPAEQSKQLSQAIVDTGLRLISLEAPTESEVQRLAPTAIAATVEDTVRRLCEADEATLEHPATLEVATTMAFQEAAAENFPPQLIVPELHESTANGTWVSLPLKGRKYYKKYTRVFDVQITPQMAESLKTFGGTTIAAFLKDKLGVTAPVQARVHIYQAMTGTSPARIARLEKGVKGLGTAAKSAWVQLHPLSPRAAGVLLQQPRLGRRAPGKFRSTRRLTAVGQRFYYLEIAGARPAAAAAVNGATTEVKRSSEANVTLDFRKDEFRVFVYLSEADAQDIAAKVRKRELTGALVAARKIYEAGVTTALGGDIQRHVKIVSEALPQEQFSGVVKGLTDAVKAKLTKKVVDWVGKGVADYIGSRAGELVTATEDPGDGVTVVVRIIGPPGAPLVRRLLKGELNPAQLAGDVESIFKGEPKLEVTTVAGFRFD